MEEGGEGVCGKVRFRVVWCVNAGSHDPIHQLFDPQKVHAHKHTCVRVSKLDLLQQNNGLLWIVICGFFIV